MMNFEKEKKKLKKCPKKAIPIKAGQIKVERN